MKRFVARILYYLGCVCAVACAAFLVVGIGWAYIQDIKAGNWWILPLAVLCGLGIFAFAVGVAFLARWASRNK